MTLAAAGPFAGRYTLEIELGRGATATVWRALDATTGTCVALKILRPELAELERAHFLREIRRTSEFAHPRILPVLDAGEAEGTLYYSLPLMPDGTLRELLRRRAQMGIADTIRIASDLAGALGHAHAHGFVHRDVKPENILFRGEEAHLTDFGIARALEPRGDESTTSRTVVRGTVAYMSPEQASGVADLDGRSDLFSLACVMYEMLAGVPAFTGPSESNILTQVLLYPPREIRVYRRNVPAALQAAIEKCLAVSPADRFADAEALVAALRAVDPDSAPRVTAARGAVTDERPAPRPLWRRALMPLTVALGAVAATMLISDGIRRGRAGGDAAIVPDTALYVVFPLAREGMDDRRSIGPPLDDDQLRDALAHWRGIELVDQFQVEDARQRLGAEPSTRELADAARALGAGRFIRGRLSTRGDSVDAYLALFDVSQSRALHDLRAVIPADPQMANAAWARAAAGLLLRDEAPSDSGWRPLVTRSLAAAHAIRQGRLALDAWDLERADSMFAAAFEHDQADPQLMFWMAQVRAWRGRAPAGWGTLAIRAAASPSALTARERRLAAPLAALAEGRFTDACALYARLRDVNARDFAAWYGLGQCRRMDRVVVPDSARGPGHWRFRSSRHAAVLAYQRAFELLPSAHRGYQGAAYRGVQDLLYLTNRVTDGFTLPDSARFASRPSWAGDTIVLVPIPLDVFSSGGPGSVPEGFAEAIRRQRALFRDIARRWSSAMPRSAEAKEAMVVALELLGDPSAVDTVRLARRLSDDPSRQLRLAAVEVRLLLRAGVMGDVAALGAARHVADSLLTANSASRRQPTSARDAEALAVMAALVGDCQAAWSMLRGSVSPEGDMGIPAHRLIESRGLTARAALRCRPYLGADELRAFSEELDRGVPATDAGRRALETGALLYRPALLADVRDVTVHARLVRDAPLALPRAALALSRGDTAGTLAVMREVSDPRAGDPPRTPDVALMGARILLAARDTAAAARWADQALGAIREVEAIALDDAVTVASLVRLIALRRDVAAARRERETETRWTKALTALRYSQ